MTAALRARLTRLERQVHAGREIVPGEIGGIPYTMTRDRVLAVMAEIAASMTGPDGRQLLPSRWAARRKNGKTKATGCLLPQKSAAD